MKKILIIVFCILTSCGYQPLYVNKEISQMTFNQVQITGDKRINNRVTSALSIIEKKDENLNNLFIDSEEIILETSKDSKGLVNTYKTNIKLTFIIKNKDQILREKIFNESFSYNNKENKFDLIEYQKEIKTMLVTKIIEDLIIYINLK